MIIAPKQAHKFIRKVCNGIKILTHETNPFFIHIDEYSSACESLNQYALLAYFVGPVPSKNMIRDQVWGNWELHSWHVDTIQNLTKHFVPYQFQDLGHCNQMISHRSWIYRTSLVVFPHGLRTSQSIVESCYIVLMPIWIEFHVQHL